MCFSVLFHSSLSSVAVVSLFDVCEMCYKPEIDIVNINKFFKFQIFIFVEKYVETIYIDNKKKAFRLRKKKEMQMETYFASKANQWFFIHSNLVFDQSGC